MQASLIKNSRAIGIMLAVVLILSVGLTGAYAGKDKKSETKGYLGVYMQKLTEDIREGLDLDVKRGVLISGVIEGSPAEEAGIEDGDIIVAFSGTEIDSPAELLDLVGAADIGEEVKVKVIREGDDKTVRVVIGERPEDFGTFTIYDDDDDIFLNWKKGDDVHWTLKNDILGTVHGWMPGPKLGVKAFEMDKDLASYFDTDEDSGVLVLEVEEESLAEEAGILPGDVIQKIDGEEVTSIDELRESLKEFEEGDEFDIAVLRHGKKKTISATMDAQEHVKWIRKGRAHIDKYKTPHLKIRKDGPHRIMIHEDDVDLKKEMDELKKELKELKKELQKLKEG